MKKLKEIVLTALICMILYGVVIVLTVTGWQLKSIGE